MLRGWSSIVIVLVHACATGCTSESLPRLYDAGPVDADPSPDTVTALFDVPRGGALGDGFYSLPYPNDIRLLDDGRIDFADHLRPNALMNDYLDVIASKQRGFGLTSAIFQRFDSVIDPDSLPPTPEASLAEDASVYLVNVDPESPNRGARVPLRFRFEPLAGESIGPNWLSALPYPGFILDEETTYALVVTRRVRSMTGRSVLAAPDFALLRSGRTGGDPELAAAAEAYQPLFDWLDHHARDDRLDVVSAAVFTTQDATSLMGRIRDVIWSDLDFPRAREFEWVISQDGYALYHGRYDSPNFQRGQLPYRDIDDGGDIAVDEATGDPIVQGMDDLRFAMTVPQTEMPAGGWPVVLYAHGTGGDFQTFVRNGTARRLAGVGIAAISIDQLMHGDRYEGGNPELDFFNFKNPLASRGNVLQAALDDFQLLRLVLMFDYREKHPGGRTIRFDSTRLFFFGHSQGSVTGVPFIASEPLIKGAILSGAGGLLYLTLLNKTLPFDVTSIVQLIIRDYPLDEFNPVLALLQAYYDGADSANYGPLLVERPNSNWPPKHIFQLEGLTDRYTPIPSIEALAVAIGADVIAPVEKSIDGFSLRGQEVVLPPVSLNAGLATAVVAQYHETEGSDGHFVAFDVPAAELQTIQFLKTLSDTNVATVVAP